MEVEAQLLLLESKYRIASDSAGAAKTLYLSLLGKLGSASHIAQAKAKWEHYECRERIVAARIAVIEKLLPAERGLKNYRAAVRGSSH